MAWGIMTSPLTRTTSLLAGMTMTSPSSSVMSPIFWPSLRTTTPSGSTALARSTNLAIISASLARIWDSSVLADEAVRADSSRRRRLSAMAFFWRSATLLRLMYMPFRSARPCSTAIKLRTSSRRAPRRTGKRLAPRTAPCTVTVMVLPAASASSSMLSPSASCRLASSPRGR